MISHNPKQFGANRLLQDTQLTDFTFYQCRSVFCHQSSSPLGTLRSLPSINPMSTQMRLLPALCASKCSLKFLSPMFALLAMMGLSDWNLSSPGSSPPSVQPVECAPVSVTCNTCPPLEPALLHQTKDAKDESALHQQAFISGTRASP